MRRGSHGLLRCGRLNVPKAQVVYNGVSRHIGLRKGTESMRSDWEAEIADYIEEEYPELDIVFNCRDIVPSRDSSRNLELDVYIPELKLAFELNGESYHDHERYKLDKEFGTCESEEMYKKQYCEEHGIKLVHIWSSKDEEDIQDKIDKHIKKRKKKIKKAKKNNNQFNDPMAALGLSMKKSIERKDFAAKESEKRKTLKMFIGEVQSKEELSKDAKIVYDSLIELGFTQEEAQARAYALTYEANEEKRKMFDRLTAQSE